MSEQRLQSRTFLAIYGTGLLTLLALCAEALLAYFVYAERMPAMFGLAAHFMIVLMLAAAYFLPMTSSHWKGGGNLGLQLIILLAVLVSGGLGALGGLALLLLIRHLPDQTVLVNDWYDRLTGDLEIDHCTHLYQTVRNNRAHGRRAAKIERFDTLMRNGRLPNKQAVLGLVALNYRPEYRTVLFHALRDAEPTIRVQGAAIFTKLQKDAKQNLRTLISERRPRYGCEAGQDAEVNPPEAAFRLQELIDGGFLDMTETAMARRRIVELGSKIPDRPLLDVKTLKIQARNHQQGELSETTLHQLEELAVNGDNEAGELYTEHLLADKNYARLHSFLACRRQLSRSAERPGG